MSSGKRETGAMETLDERTSEFFCVLYEYFRNLSNLSIQQCTLLKYMYEKCLSFPSNIMYVSVHNIAAILLVSYFVGRRV